jgi:hypothetical protein
MARFFIFMARLYITEPYRLKLLNYGRPIDNKHFMRQLIDNTLNDAGTAITLIWWSKGKHLDHDT